MNWCNRRVAPQKELRKKRIPSKLGRSRPVITETLAFAAIPEPVRELCLKKNVMARASLLQVARAGSREKMEAAVLRIASGGGAATDVARERKEAAAPVKGRPKHFQFRWAAPEKTFAVQLKFRKSRVSKDEVIAAVRTLLVQLEGGD